MHKEPGVCVSTNVVVYTEYCLLFLTVTVYHSTVVEHLPGMGKVAGSNPAGTHLCFFVSAVGAIGVAPLKLQYDYIG